MLVWRTLLPLLKFVLPLRTLARLLWTEPAARVRKPEREARILRLIARAYRLGQSHDNCLERSLLTYRLLSARNAEPRLVIGFKKAAEDLEGHAWVLVDGLPVHDSPEFIADFTPLGVFAEGGAVEAPLRPRPAEAA